MTSEAEAVKSREDEMQTVKPMENGVTHNKVSPNAITAIDAPVVDNSVSEITVVSSKEDDKTQSSEVMEDEKEAKVDVVSDSVSAQKSESKPADVDILKGDGEKQEDSQLEKTNDEDLVMKELDSMMNKPDVEVINCDSIDAEPIIVPSEIKEEDCSNGSRKTVEGSSTGISTVVKSAEDTGEQKDVNNSTSETVVETFEKDGINGSNLKEEGDSVGIALAVESTEDTNEQKDDKNGTIETVVKTIGEDGTNMSNTKVGDSVEIAVVVKSAEETNEQNDKQKGDKKNTDEIVHSDEGKITSEIDPTSEVVVKTVEEDDQKEVKHPVESSDTVKQTAACDEVNATLPVTSHTEPIANITKDVEANTDASTKIEEPENIAKVSVPTEDADPKKSEIDNTATSGDKTSGDNKADVNDSVDVKPISKSADDENKTQVTNDSKDEENKVLSKEEVTSGIIPNENACNDKNSDEGNTIVQSESSKEESMNLKSSDEAQPVDPHNAQMAEVATMEEKTNDNAETLQTNENSKLSTEPCKNNAEIPLEKKSENDKFVNTDTVVPSAPIPEETVTVSDAIAASNLIASELKQEYQTTIESLRSEKTVLNEDLLKTVKKMERLEREKSDIKAELNYMRETHTIGNVEKFKASAERDAAQDALGKLAREKTVLEESLHRASIYEIEKDRLNAELSETTKLLSSVRTKREILDIELDEQKERNESVNKEMKKLKNLLDKTMSNDQRKTTQLKELADLKFQYDEILDQVANSVAETNTLKKSLSDAEHDKAEQEAIMTDLKVKLEALSSKNNKDNEMNRQVRNMKSKVEEYSDRMNVLEQERDLLNEQLKIEKRKVDAQQEIEENANEKKKSRLCIIL